MYHTRNKMALNRPTPTLRFDNFKLVRYNDNNEVELYNLDNDLSEMKDLSKKKPDKTAELNEILEKYLISVKAYQMGRRYNMEKPKDRRIQFNILV